MKQLVKGSAALTAVSLGEMTMRFVRTKCIAMVLGPAGTGFLAQLTIFFELMRVWGDLGSRRGVIKQIAELRRMGSPQIERYGEVIKTSYFLALLASGLTGLFVTLFSREISHSLYGTAEHYPFIIALAALLPVASLSTVTASIVKGNLEYMSFAKYTVMSYVAVILVTPLIIYFTHYWGAILVQALFMIFPLAGYLIFNARHRFLIFSKKINYLIMKEQFSYGFVQVYQDSLTQATRVLISAWIVKKMGLSLMGIYQVVTTFSTIYLTIPIQVMSGYALPLIAASTQPKEVTRAVNDAMRFLLFILAPVIIGVMIWPEVFIYCFFSADFLSAVFPLEIQLLGTLFMLITFPFGVALQAKGHLKALMLTATVTPLVNVALTWLFFDIGDLTGVALAFCLTGLGNLLLYYFLMRNYYGMQFLPKNKRLLICTVVWILLAFLAGAVIKFWLFRLLVTALGIPWFILSSKNHEREYLLTKLSAWQKGIKKFLSGRFFPPRV